MPEPILYKYLNGDKQWWLYGREYTQEEFALLKFLNDKIYD